MPRIRQEYTRDPHEGPAIAYGVQYPRRGLLLTVYLIVLFGWYAASSWWVWTLTPDELNTTFGTSLESINILIGCFQTPIFAAIYGMWYWQRWGIWATGCVLLVNICLSMVYTQQVMLGVNVAFLVGLVLIARTMYHQFGVSTDAA